MWTAVDSRGQGVDRAWTAVDSACRRLKPLCGQGVDSCGRKTAVDTRDKPNRGF